MGARVAVAGASGYAGGELLRLLAGHPDLEIGPVTGQSSAGRPIAEVHPHLASVPSLAARPFDALESVAGSGCDLVFLALPAGESAPLADGLDPAVRVVDLGPDFRLSNASAWARHYQQPHAGRWVTGLPELPGAREQIRAASRVAVPGCYATASIVALTPLMAAGLVEPHDIVIVAASGTSGGGRSLRPDLLASEVMGAVSAYQAGGTHRHTPEIEQALGEAADLGAAGGQGAGGHGAGGHGAGGHGAGGHGAGGQGAGGHGAGGHLAGGHLAGGHRAGGPGVTVGFTPILVPMPRGILATCTARLTGDPATAPVRQAIADRYTGEPFVCLLPEGRWPTTAAVAGSNGVHLQAAADARTGRVTVVAAIDNLGKGAAGQAIQNANLMLGLPETAGLSAIGVAP